LAIDETWIPLHAPPPRDKQKFWLEPGAPRPEIPKEELGERKRMLIMAMDYRDIAFWHLCDEGQTVNSEVYRDFLDRNIATWKAKHNIRKPIILHDNARPHKSKLVTEYLRDHNIETWNQAPYSPDVQPCDYNCFGPFKRQLKGTRYNNSSELIDAINKAINEGTQKGLYQGIKMLPDRWQKVIDKEGSYI
jgi:transposase